MRVSIHGGAKLRAAINRAQTGAPPAWQKALYRGANRVFNRTQTTSPWDTGVLRGSGTLELRGDEAEIRYGGAAAHYAIYVHEGTSKMAGRPWVENALTEMGAEVVREVRDAVDGAI